MIKPKATAMSTAHKPKAKLVDWLVATQPKTQGARMRGGPAMRDTKLRPAERVAGTWAAARLNRQGHRIAKPKPTPAKATTFMAKEGDRPRIMNPAVASASEASISGISPYLARRRSP